MQRTLFIGLGNPGDEHAGTYHNAGWDFLNFLKVKLDEKYGPTTGKEGKNFRFYQYGKYCLVYPNTYMNLSGEAVKAAIEWFHKEPAETVVFYDDSDLMIGDFKETLLLNSGDAGHRGIGSVMASMASPDILRVRIGIRDPREKNGEHPRRKAGEFVLKRISKDDREALEKVFAELSLKFLKGS